MPNSILIILFEVYVVRRIIASISKSHCFPVFQIALMAIVSVVVLYRHLGQLSRRGSVAV